MLLYRRSTDRGSWEKGLLASGAPVDFSAQGIEDELGYAQASWDVSGIVDSTYKIKVQSQCTDLGGVADDRTYDTGTIEFILDRVPPAIYGKPQVELTGPVSVVQDEEFGFSFKEPLFCDEPYTFDLTVTLSNDGNVQTMSHGNGLHAKCLAADIRFRFERQALDGFSTNTTVTLTLSGVQDLAGNQMETYNETFLWNQTVTNQAAPIVQTSNSTSVAASPECYPGSSIKLAGLGCDGIDNNCDMLIDECNEDLVMPKITFREGLAIDASEENGYTIINSPSFLSLSSAKVYIESIIEAKDDCATDLVLTVENAIGVACHDTKFTVTATDGRCPTQTVQKQFKIKVDDSPPVVSITLDLGEEFENKFEAQGRTYLGIVSLQMSSTPSKLICPQHPSGYAMQSESYRNYEHTGFSYTVTVRKVHTTLCLLDNLSHTFDARKIVLRNLRLRLRYLQMNLNTIIPKQVIIWCC